MKELEIYLNNFETAFKNFDLKIALDSTFAFLDEVNLYITQKEPWNMLKFPSNFPQIEKILYTSLESIRQVAMSLYPFFPEKMGQVFNALNLKDYVNLLEK
jgi:methionyl-tRNA synthetase